MTTNTDPRLDPTRVIRAPRGNQLHCKSWVTEAAYRMVQNNLDPEVAENPQSLVVYGGIGRAARDWACFDQILASLKDLNEDETLLVQSGKPVGVFKTHANAPRVLIANSNLVPKWATWSHFNELDRKGLFMYGQMTAGSWIYIGSQGIVQGTFETFVEAGKQHYGNDLSGRWILTAGLGGMGGEINLDDLALKRLQLIGVTFRTRSMAERIACFQAMARDLGPLLGNDHMRPLVSAVFPFDQVTEAQDHMVTNQHIGKIVIQVA